MTPFIVAEISASHNGSLERALDTIQAAAEAGADGVKFQTFTPSNMAIPGYRIEHGPWKGRDLVGLYKEAHTPAEWYIEMFSYAEELGLVPFSTPFDIEAVDFLEYLNCPLYKIASFELVDQDLISAVAATGKPMIMSTGMATRKEISQAVSIAEHSGCKSITLLHCVSEYPAPVENINLNTMLHLRTLKCDVGLSDHTEGIITAVAATALGATVIEKHITLTKDGLDSGFALLPGEFKEMVDGCRTAALAMGQVTYSDGKGELRRSLYWDKDLPSGTRIERKHMKTARPALGLSPLDIHKVIGSTLKRDVKEDEPV